MRALFQRVKEAADFEDERIVYDSGAWLVVWNYNLQITVIRDYFERFPHVPAAVITGNDKDGRFGSYEYYPIYAYPLRKIDLHRVHAFLDMFEKEHSKSKQLREARRAYLDEERRHEIKSDCTNDAAIMKELYYRLGFANGASQAFASADEGVEGQEIQRWLDELVWPWQYERPMRYSFPPRRPMKR